MIARVRSLVSKAWQWFRGLPLAAAILIGVLVFVGFTSAGVWGYKKWDYIEHDNNFCLDCHLMVDPFQRVSESAHRDMSCKACHNPSMLGRAQMALTQVIQNPDSLTAHAEVPNETCASCHVYGDPDTWNTIARSGGHRVHFESDDPDLDGLMCVECHSASLHDFHSTDETCRECHEDNDIIMAGMHDVAMNCGSCHTFNAPVEAIAADAALEPSQEGALEGILSPGQGECLGCHTMRGIVAFDDDDPHEAACGVCHNPHTQDAGTDALEGCTAAGCHDGPVQDLSTFHAGIASETLASCLDCHDAHDFHAEGQDCLACHTDVFEDGGSARAPVDVGSDAHAGPGGFTGIGFTEDAAKLGLHVPAPTPGSPSWVHQGGPSGISVPAPDSVFRHAQHEDLDCLSCHTMDTSHGEVTVGTTLGDCRQCHHTPPRSDDCTTCHAESVAVASSYPMPVVFELSLGESVERTLAFDHDDHAAEDCSTCHTGGVNMDAAQVDCSECHEEHHGEDVGCTTCHTPSPREEHDVTAHVGCASADCHVTTPFEGVPRERRLCLVCHVEQSDHKVEAPETCADCHALPEHGTTAGVGG